MTSDDDKKREEMLRVFESSDDAVPVPTSTALVSTTRDARALVKKIAGDEVPSECLFHCITCGWGQTLKFDEGEMAALDGDVTTYAGPCPECSSMTLVPKNSLWGGDVNLHDMARKNRREEAMEVAEVNADVMVDRFRREVVTVMSGSTLGKTPEEQHDIREDLPDAESFDVEGLKPREG